VTVVKQVYPPAEQLHIAPGSESVTIEKRKIFLCLRDKQGVYYPFDVLLYVLLHELAHVVSKSYSPSHNKEFKDNFEALLQRARDYGYLLKITHVPENYCKQDF
jgi:predicted metal-dependent hydrolase